MDTQPKIPTLKDSQKPQVKVRGLEAGVTLFDRLKQFKKKDLAFILAGLGTLFMAPLAEHFMMSPETGDGQLQQGWGGKGAGGKGMFDGTGASPYEPGTTGLAPGSAVGGGSDIITPLNVRDPSALVMGPGATQQPPTSSVMPATPPPTAVATHSDSDLKDALAASARGVTAAAHAAKALLPMPKIALAGSGGLRGLGVVSGGTSAVAGNAPSSNGLVTGRAANGGNFGGVRAPNGYKGVARSPTGGGGGDAALKAAGDAAAGMFNKGGSAFQGATDAANAAIPNGGSGLGGGGAGGVGANDKANGGDQNKDGKNVGESLAFLKQKAIQEAQIALWAKEQEAGDNKLEALKIRNSMAEAFTSKIAGIAADQVGCLMTGNAGSNCPSADSGSGNYVCDGGNSASASAIAKNASACTADSSKDNPTPKGKTWYKDGPGTGGVGIKLSPCGTAGHMLDHCQTDSPSKGDDAPAPPQKSVTDLANLGTQCTKLAAPTTGVPAPTTDAGKKAAADQATFVAGYQTQMGNEASLRNDLNGTPSDASCGADSNGQKTSIAAELQDVVALMTKKGNNAAIDDQMMGAVSAKAAADGSAAPWASQYANAQTEFKDAKDKFAKLQTKFTAVNQYLTAKSDDPSKFSALANAGDTSSFTTLRSGFGDENTPGSVAATNSVLKNQIAALDPLFTSADKVAGDKGTLKAVMAINAQFGSPADATSDKIAKYNQAAGALTPAPAATLTATAPPASDPPKPSGNVDGDIDKVNQAITAVDTAAKGLNWKTTAAPVADTKSLGAAMDTFIQTPSAANALQATAATPPVTPPAGTAATAPTLDVSPVATAIGTAQQAQTAALTGLSQNFQAVGTTLNGVTAPAK